LQKTTVLSGKYNMVKIKRNPQSGYAQITDSPVLLLRIQMYFVILIY